MCLDERHRCYSHAVFAHDEPLAGAMARQLY